MSRIIYGAHVGMGRFKKEINAYWFLHVELNPSNRFWARIEAMGEPATLEEVTWLGLENCRFCENYDNLLATVH
ncbi:hypothetical protein [Bremerella alba]|uniref:Uncharacterized protein n=1 Tax=Bremerella alba TaxID=980252 RepID=A0A7V8V9U8_9BACT|nr:hypothetical protein [Bremerella alba]MBA2117556.1 hypothetical protein [Bremerella alba]